MGTRIYLPFCFLLLLVVSRSSLAQNPDSTFRRQHSLNRPDQSFIFLRDRGPWESLSIGRWWLMKDSLICLNWFDLLSLEMAKRPKIDYLHKTISDPVFTYLPTRIDHWWFVRRGPQLVPY
jgi:hypothetical protein